MSSTKLTLLTIVAIFPVKKFIGLNERYAVFYDESQNSPVNGKIHTPNDPDATVPSVTNQLIPTRMYRWVVIKGSLISQMEEAEIDMDNYNEVKAFFNNRNIQMKTGSILR